MKNKKFIYKNCQGAISKRNQREIKIRKWLGGLLLLAITFTGYFGWAMEFPNYVSATVNVEKPLKLTNKEKSLKYLVDAGIDEDTIFEWKCLMKRENRDYEEFAYNVNENGTLDFGFLQINDKVPPKFFKNVSMECKADVDCIMPFFVEYLKQGGTLDPWLGWKNKCK